MIYLRETNPNTPYKYEVVDGQQRLRAVWEFQEDGYSLAKDFEPVGTVKIAGKKYSELPPVLRKRIDGFRIVAAYVKSAKEPEISRLFSRMQMGVRLNPPELRNAVQCGLRHVIDGTARAHPFFKESRIQAGRFKHQDFLAHAVSMCFHGGSKDLKAPQLMKDYETIVKASEYQPLMAAAHDILDFLKGVNDQTSKRITQKWIFVDLFYLLYESRSKLGKIDVTEFATTYRAFDKDRLAHTAAPEQLIAGSVTTQRKQLYDYIQAFKISGGDQKNLKRRHEVLKKRFAKVFV